MYPVYNGQPQMNYNNPLFPTYILNGAGGNREGTSGIRNDRPVWSANAVNDWGYGILTVVNDTCIDFSFYTASNGQLADRFIINNDHKWN